MSFNLATQLFSKIDGVTAEFVGEFSTRVIAEATPAIVAGLTLAFMGVGVLTILGVVQQPIHEFLKRSFFTMVIVAVALNVGFYQETIATVITQMPDAFATSLLATPSTDGTVGTLIDTAAEKGFVSAQQAFIKASILSETGLVYCIYAALIIVSTVALVSIGCAFILLAKVALALLAALGPIFICALLFKWSRGLFDRWLSQILSYTLLLVMFASVFGLLMSMFGNFMGKTAFDGIQNPTINLGAAMIISATSVLILWQLPALAAALAGGVGVGFYHESRQVASTARGAYRGGAALVNNRLTRAVAGGAVQGVAAGGRAVAGLYKGKGGRG